MLVAKADDRGLVFIVDSESRSRMDKGDPFTINLKSLGIPLNLDIAIGSATSEEIASFSNPIDLFKHVFRGFERRPEDNFDPFNVKFGKDKHD